MVIIINNKQIHLTNGKSTPVRVPKLQKTAVGLRRAVRAKALRASVCRGNCDGHRYAITRGIGKNLLVMVY